MQIRPTAFTIGLIIHHSIALFCVYTEFGIDSRDVAGLLYNCYPEKCEEVLKDISAMSVQTGLPQYYISLSVSAEMTLKHGIPKDFP